MINQINPDTLLVIYYGLSIVLALCAILYFISFFVKIIRDQKLIKRKKQIAVQELQIIEDEIRIKRYNTDQELKKIKGSQP